MKNAVVIKGNKAGMSVILDPELPFEELLTAVKNKFRETSRFWGSVQMWRSYAFLIPTENGSNDVRRH